MTKIALMITITKYTNHFENINYYHVFNSYDEAKNELISCLIKQIQHLTIDFPMDLNDFEYIWFKQYVNASFFTYKIFSDKWEEPWEPQEIYADILDKMFEIETTDPPEFSEIYGEPDPDEEKIDKFTMDNDESIKEIEKKFSKIIEDSKNIQSHDEEVKECKCNKCLESIHSS